MSTARTLSTAEVAPTAPSAKTEKPSKWLWVPLIWLFFVSTRELSVWMEWDRPVATNTDLGGSPVDRVLMISLMVLGFYILHLRWNQTRRILANNKWIVALFLLSAASVIWSNFPGMTVRRFFRSAGNLEMVLVVLTERNPLEAVRVLLRRLYVLIIPLSAYAIKYMRNIGVAYDWSGVEEEWVGLSTDKNSLGQVAMLSGLFLFWDLLHDWSKRKVKRIRRRLLLEVAVLAVSMWLLRGSKNVHSSTSIVGFLSCSAVLISLQFIKKRSRRAKRIILASAMATVLIAPIVSMVFDALNTTPVQLVLQATGRDMTLTDRNLIWTDVLNNAAKHPILGVGFGAYWVGPIGYDLYPMPNWSAKTPEWRPEEGHNGYIDVYAQLGLAGEIVLIGAIVSAFSGALSHLETDFQFGSMRLVLLLSIVINNATETSFLKGTHDLWFLFLLFAINLPRPVKKAVAKRIPAAWSDPGKPAEADGSNDVQEGDSLVYTRQGIPGAAILNTRLLPLAGGI